MIYSNDQWIVDENGIVGVDGADGHTPNQLLTIRGDNHGLCYDLPIHMAEKMYVDINLFLEAWVRAVDEFVSKVPHTMSAEILERTCRQARSISAALAEGG